jgi:hypothetical protein
MKTLIAVLLAGSFLAFGSSYDDQASWEAGYLRRAKESLAAQAAVEPPVVQTREYRMRLRDGSTINIWLPVGMSGQRIVIERDGHEVSGFVY